MVEFLKSSSPFFTFILGILLTSTVEKIKDSVRQKRLRENIVASLRDEYLVVKNGAITIAESIRMRSEDPKPFLHLPAPIDTHILSKYLYETYNSIEPERRKAYKMILIHKKTIDEKTAIVRESYRDDNEKCFFAECSMLNSTLIIFYIINDLMFNGKSYKFPTLPTYEIVGKAAEALDVYDVYDVYLRKVK